MNNIMISKFCTIAKEFTKFMNEEVEFKEIKPWMK